MERATPSPLSSALFRAKVAALQGKRFGQNLATRPLKFPRALELPTCVMSEARSRLWREDDPREFANEQGKVQNLRVVTKYLDRLQIPAGQTFSFWKHVGRTTRAKGFVVGRQIQEGCLIPALGGGICQLTNLLYEAALTAGFEIRERHPHTRQVPGSHANKPDATVKWNHIDLRFSPQCNVVLRVVLTADELVVQFLGERESKRTLLPLVQTKPAQVANSCASCGVEECFRHEELVVSHGRQAVLVDQLWPEYADLLLDEGVGKDLLCVPLDPRRFDRANYRWPVDGAREVKSASFDTLLRSWRSRRLANEGPVRRKASLNADEALARTYAKFLRADIVSLSVYQQFLPYLWRDGHLGGRRYDVLMTRLPILELQRRLDWAAKSAPERKSLSDFRAGDWVGSAEKEALARAEKIFTPHTEIAALFADKAVLVPWKRPAPRRVSPGRAIGFPGPAIARKGSEVVRDVAKSLSMPLVLVGFDLESPGFWDGVEMKQRAEFWLDGVACVVQPAVMEDQPRRLLQALACGVPVVATKECGIPSMDGLTIARREDFVDVVRSIVQ